MSDVEEPIREQGDDPLSGESGVAQEEERLIDEQTPGERGDAPGEWSDGDERMLT